MRADPLKPMPRRTWVSRAGRCLSAVAFSFALASCASVTFDMRGLQQPVVMNGNAIAGRTDSSPSSGAVDTFAATVAYAQFTASTPTGNQGQIRTQSDRTVVNEAQVKAFEKIGGDPTGSITHVALDYDCRSINGLIALGTGVFIVANGKVRRQGVPDAPEPVKESGP